MKAIALIRVSTEEQGESGLGLAAQRTMLETFAQANGIDVSEVITAVHSSASDEHYKLLADLLARAKRRKEVILVSKVDRFGRSTKAMAMLEESKVRLVVAELGLAAGQIVIDMLAAVAKEERRLISSRTKAALQALKAKGQRLGTACLITKAGAPVAMSAAEKGRRAAIAMKAQPLTGDRRALVSAALEGGRTYRAAAQWLNEREVPTATGEGQWHPIQVQRAALKLGLRSTHYAGRK